MVARVARHTHKGHREKILKVTNLRVFSGCLQGIFREFQGVFRVFIPMPFPGMPFGPFQPQANTPALLYPANPLDSLAGGGQAFVVTSP